LKRELKRDFILKRVEEREREREREKETPIGRSQEIHTHPTE
jgi:hypothetical protein